MGVSRLSIGKFLELVNNLICYSYSHTNKVFNENTR